MNNNEALANEAPIEVRIARYEALCRQRDWCLVALDAAFESQVEGIRERLAELTALCVKASQAI